MKKIYSFVLLAVTLLLSTNIWADPVAKVTKTADGTSVGEYEMMTDALAAWTDGTTLTILDDHVTYDATEAYKVSDARTLNLNGRTLVWKGTGSFNLISVEANGSLNIINGSGNDVKGKLEAELILPENNKQTKHLAAIYNKGALTIDGVSVSFAITNNKAGGQMGTVVKDNGKSTIKNCDLSIGKGCNIGADIMSFSTSHIYETVSISYAGAEQLSNLYGFYSSASTATTETKIINCRVDYSQVKGCTSVYPIGFTGTAKGSIEGDNGYFATAGNDAYAIQIKGDMIVKGGTFIGQVITNFGCIDGGQFSVEPKAQCASKGKGFEKNSASGYYELVDKEMLFGTRDLVSSTNYNKIYYKNDDINAFWKNYIDETPIEVLTTEEFTIPAGKKVKLCVGKSDLFIPEAVRIINNGEIIVEGENNATKFTHNVTIVNNGVVNLAGKSSSSLITPNGKLHFEKQGTVKVSTGLYTNEEYNNFVKNNLVDGVGVYQQEDGNWLVGIEAATGNKGYATLTNALKNAKGAVVTLAKDAEISSTFPQSSSFILDLNGHTLTIGSATIQDKSVTIASGSWTFRNGTIKCTAPEKSGVFLYNPNGAASITIEQDVNIECTGDGYLFAFLPNSRNSNKCDNAILNFAGTAKCPIFATVNGQIPVSDKCPVITIKKTANISCSSMGIYAAGYAIWNIQGKMESQTTGIYSKAGIVNVDGGTIIAHGQYHKPEAQGSGAISTGDAIIMDSKAGYTGNMQLNIKGNAHIESENGYAIHEAWTDEVASKAQSLTIESGVFIGGKDNTAVHLSNEFRQYVTESASIKGGVFNSNVANAMTGIVPTNYATTEALYYNGKTMYVVHPAAEAALNINSNNGLNADKAIAVSTLTNVENAQTKAHYVEVTSENTLTVGKGKTLTIGEGGLVVAEQAKVIVEVGGTLKVGQNGVIAPKVENILVKANAEGAGEFLVAPEVTFNPKPYGTVELYTEVGKKADGTYQWQRFGSPVEVVNELGNNKSDVKTAIYKWDNSLGDWASLGGKIDAILPFAGFAITNNQTTISPVTYSFLGQMVGNADSKINLDAKGYHYLANSYTGYVHTYTMLKSVMNENVEGTVWLQDGAEERCYGVSMLDLQEGDDEYAEVAPLQTFILQVIGEEKQVVDINYTEAVWNNPLRNKQAAKVPQQIEETEDAYVRITVKDEKNNTDRVNLREGEQYSDNFDNGADASKLEEKGYINFYATTNYGKQSAVASDKICGTKLSLQTLEGTQFTMTFSKIRGTKYAIKDMVTNKVVLMSEGNTYQFTATANSTEQDRFTIVDASEVPTDAEMVEVENTKNGIWTMLGQYVGEAETWNTLPTGVYIVNGQKIVK